MKWNRYFLLIICFLIGFQVQGRDKDNLDIKILENQYMINIEAGVIGSVLSMREIVYNGKGSDNIISEIEYNVNFQAGTALGLNFSPIDIFKKMGFSVNSFFIWYFSTNNGRVVNSDWDEEGIKYSEARANVSVLSGGEIDGSIRFLLPIKDMVCLQFGVNIYYARFIVAASDGKIRQSLPGETIYYDTEAINLYGRSMEYNQEWIVFSPEIGVRGKLGEKRRFEGGINIAISPLIWGYHIDSHYFRSYDENDRRFAYLVYEDKTGNGLYLRARGNVNWKITKNLLFEANVEYKTILGTRGDTNIKTTGMEGNIYKEKDAAGAEMSNIKFGIIFKVGL